MKLERLPEYVTVAVVTALGLGLALAVGRFAGGGQLGAIISIVGALAAAGIVLSLGRAVWLLIPATWMLEGRIPDLALPFAVRDLVVMAIFVTYGAFVALKFVKHKPKIGILDILILANLLYLALTFVRNPVGVDALGSDRVGGRPYYDIFIGGLAYLVFRRATCTERDLKLLPWIITGSAFVVSALNVIAQLSPLAASFIGRFYTGVAQAIDTSARSEQSREQHLAGLGSIGATLLCAKFSPITLVLPIFFWRFALFTGMVVLVALSGHRSALLYVMMTFVLAAYYRNRVSDAVKVGAVGAVLIAFLVIGQGRLFNLPFAVQRTLSWIPGDWEYAAVADAKASTEWRVQMWRIALTDPTYIENKWLGDGFGLTQWDLGIISQAETARRMGFSELVTSQEVALRTGRFHSGPITTLHIVGVFGLAPYYALIINIAVLAHRLILRARGTNLFVTALFVCIPHVYLPFTFTIVFGDFATGMPVTLMSVGLLQLLSRGVEQARASLPDTAVERSPEFARDLSGPRNGAIPSRRRPDIESPRPAGHYGCPGIAKAGSESSNELDARGARGLMSRVT